MSTDKHNSHSQAPGGHDAASKDGSGHDQPPSKPDMSRRELLTAGALGLAASALSGKFGAGSPAFAAPIAGPANQSPPRPAVPSWSELLDLAIKSPAAQPYLKQIVADARTVLGMELVQRMYRLEDLGVKGRSWRDPRTRRPNLDPKIREIAALAHSDTAACGGAAGDLGLLACAYRITGEKVFLDRLILQMKEVTTWSPFQRAGWNYALPGPDGKGGAWLATPSGVYALVNTIRLLPPNCLPADLMQAVNKRLESEIAEITDDWATKRTWFIRTNNAFTNQWIAPTVGLVEACLFLGPERFPDAFRLGLKNVRQSVECHGPEGAFEEGFCYSHYVRLLFNATHSLAVAGHGELYNHPFLKNFGTWYVHNYQPNGFYINAFDCIGGARETVQPADHPGVMERRARVVGADQNSRAAFLSLVAVCTGNNDALWGLHNLEGGPPPNLTGVAAQMLLEPNSARPTRLFAAYDRARRVNWRSSWQPDASGFWIRGGHSTDQHDHNDRGHINFIAQGRPILIEAGTPIYSNPKIASHYASSAGHNVLHLGLGEPETGNNAQRMNPPRGWQKRSTVVPLKVHRLDAEGGKVEADGSSAYDGLDRWLRTVEWNAKSLYAIDEVDVLPEQTEIVRFRWHLGVRDGVTIVTDAHGWPTARWSDAELQVTANQPIQMEITKMPDHTLRHRIPDNVNEDVDDEHICLVVRTTNKVESVRMETKIKALPA